jgi:predicted dinucleotide-binding enzyme
MNIGIIGSGNVGGALGQRWAEKGHAVMFGARDPNSDKAKAALANIPGAHIGNVRDAADFGDAILIAVPGGAVLDTVRACASLQGKVLMDAANWFGERPTGVTRSLAEAIADAAPGARVVKAFNTTGANNMLNPRYGAQNADMFICGDDADAKATVAGLSRDIGFDVVDAGPLSAALLLENLAQLWVHLARSGAGRDIAWKLMRR